MAQHARVIFVAPFFMDATVRFLDAVASLPGVRCALISQDPVSKLPAALRHKLVAHYGVADGLNAGQIAQAATILAGQLGGIDRLFGTLEQIQIQLAQVREHLGIEGMGAAAIRNFREKNRMKDVLRAAGLPCARHATIESVADAERFIRQVDYPVVIKPPDGAGSVATYRARSDAELRQALAALRPAPGRAAMMEEFVTGQENSLETVCIGGEPVWDSHTRYLPQPLTVVENPWIQWCVLLPRQQSDADTAAIRGPARAALKALGVGTALTHMEWFMTSRGAVISEVAARPPGALIVPLNSYAHDVDFHAMWARLMVFEEFHPPVRSYATGAVFFRGQRRRPASGEGAAPGRIIKLHGLEQAQQELGHLVVESRLPQLGHTQRATYEGDGHAILRHPDTEVVHKALMRLISLVQVEVA